MSREPPGARRCSWPRARVRGYLGWDVGAWHCQLGASRDALVLLKDGGDGLNLIGAPWRGNLWQTYNAEPGEALLARLLGLVGSRTAHACDELFIAIDTPLGWPDAFRRLLDGEAPAEVPGRKAANPLLLRDSERWLAESGHMPLSAVQDQIGSQSTKGIAFLAALGLQPQGTGVWAARVGATDVTALETYPAPCRHSASIDRARHRVDTDLSQANPDVRDALTCALVAWTFANCRDTLVPPREHVPEREGWIWVPADCIPKPKTS